MNCKIFQECSSASPITDIGQCNKNSNIHTTRASHPQTTKKSHITNLMGSAIRLLWTHVGSVLALADWRSGCSALLGQMSEAQILTPPVPVPSCRALIMHSNKRRPISLNQKRSSSSIQRTERKRSSSLARRRPRRKLEEGEINTRRKTAKPTLSKIIF